MHLCEAGGVLLAIFLPLSSARELCMNVKGSADSNIESLDSIERGDLIIGQGKIFRAFLDINDCEDLAQRYSTARTSYIYRANMDDSLLKISPEQMRYPDGRRSEGRWAIVKSGKIGLDSVVERVQWRNGQKLAPGTGDNSGLRKRELTRRQLPSSQSRHSSHSGRRRAHGSQQRPHGGRQNRQSSSESQQSPDVTEPSSSENQQSSLGSEPSLPESQQNPPGSGQHPQEGHQSLHEGQQDPQHGQQVPHGSQQSANEGQQNLHGGQQVPHGSQQSANQAQQNLHDGQQVPHGRPSVHGSQQDFHEDQPYAHDAQQHAHEAQRHEEVHPPHVEAQDAHEVQQEPEAGQQSLHNEHQAPRKGKKKGKKGKKRWVKKRPKPNADEHANERQVTVGRDKHGHLAMIGKPALSDIPGETEPKCKCPGKEVFCGCTILKI